MDRRAEAEVKRLSAEDMRRKTGINVDPSHMAAKIRWLRRHDRSARGAARFHQPVSYRVARLTGEHVYDHGLASTTMLYALAQRGHRGGWADHAGTARADREPAARFYVPK
jgi:xylulokinase